MNQGLERTLKSLIPFKNMKTFLSSIIESSNDGIWVCNGAGKILYNNRASEKLTGIRCEEVLGKNVAALVEQGMWKESVTLGVIRTMQKYTTIQNVLRTGKQLLSTATPVFDENGELELVVTIERDITLLIDMQKHLEKVKKRESMLAEELRHAKQLETIRETFVVESPAMSSVVKNALRIANLNESNILITGESGTGKGALAKIIHNMSNRSGNQFIQINCAALPDSLLEAELFGYEKGAFTGSKENGKIGLIELADSGTLFLDEIGDLPLSTQAKLLSYLDNHTITPLGSTISRKIESTIIAATNQDLARMVDQKKFRKDLLFRLNTFRVKIPPLRDRIEDIFALTSHFVCYFNRKYKVSKKISSKALESLMLYNFPGNIRELKNIIKRAVAICDRQTIDEAILQSISQSSQEAKNRDNSLAIHSQSDLNKRVASFENAIIKRALYGCKSTRELATVLNISQPSVVRRLKKHGLRISSRDSNGIV